MNRRIIAMGAGLTLIGSLAACGGSGSGDAQSSAGQTGTVSSVGSTPAGSVAPAGGLNLTKNANPTKIVVASVGGPSQEALQKNAEGPFTKATGNTFTNISPVDSTKIAAMEEAGKPLWDVVTVTPSFVNAHCGTYFEKIDTSLYSNLAKYPAGSVTPCMVPDSRYAFVEAYNTDKFKNNPPTSIKDFFDTEKYPGKRLVIDGAGWGLYEAALVASGVDPQHLYPLDISRAEKEMDKIKKDLILAPTGAAAQQAFVSGQEAMTLMATARLGISVDAGAHLAPVWDFTSYVVSGFSILKGAPHVQAAQQFAAFLSTKPIEIKHAAANGFAPVNPDIQISEVPFTATQKTFNAFQSGRGTVVLEDPGWYGKNLDKLTLAYTKWKVS